MPRFLAQTNKGLVDCLYNELNALGFEKLEKVPGGVFFETNWAGCYRANLRLRTATRVLLTILDFSAYNEDDVYHNVQKHDYTKYIDPKQSVWFEAHAESAIFRDSRFLAQKVKDAVVDQFRDKTGDRPDVDKETAGLRLHIRAVGSDVSVSIDTSGQALFQRGYRVKPVEAPLKEHLAAALVDISGWTPDIPLVDPLCGSGTILIEAALKASGIAPGTLRKRFGFNSWKTFQRDVWDQEVDAALALEKEMPKGKIFGFDVDRHAVFAGQQNAEAAGIRDYVEIRRKAMEMIEAPPTEEKGMIITNPPYGVRLGEVDELKDLYRDLGFIMKSRFKGWTAWVLSGDPDLPALMGMKASQRVPVFNGPIECRFLKYEIRNS